MDSQQQRALNKLYGATATLLSVTAAFKGIPHPTLVAKEDYARSMKALEHIRLASDYLSNDPNVEDEFQIELPF